MTAGAESLLLPCHMDRGTWRHCVCVLLGTHWLVQVTVRGEMCGKQCRVHEGQARLSGGMHPVLCGAPRPKPRADRRMALGGKGR